MTRLRSSREQGRAHLQLLEGLGSDRIWSQTHTTWQQTPFRPTPTSSSLRGGRVGRDGEHTGPALFYWGLPSQGHPRTFGHSQRSHRVVHPAGGAQTRSGPERAEAEPPFQCPERSTNPGLCSEGQGAQSEEKAASSGSSRQAAGRALAPGLWHLTVPTSPSRRHRPRRPAGRAPRRSRSGHMVDPRGPSGSGRPRCW